jgi:hypothetical protein
VRRTSAAAPIARPAPRRRGAPEATAWLDARDPPVREGVYRRQAPAGPYSCWSAEQWFGDAPSVAAAAAARRPSTWQHARWAGISQAPDEPCALCRGLTVIDHGHDEAGDLIDECPEC